MESLNSHQAYLNNLQSRAAKLTATGHSLITLLTNEARRLKCGDEVSQLRMLLSVTLKEIDRARTTESSANHTHRQSSWLISAGGLAISLMMGMHSKDQLMSNISKGLVSNLTNDGLSFGNVIVSVGPSGIPGEVEVVSISRLARETKRREIEVMNELSERGYLLFTEKTFSLLIDKLIEGVLQGQMSLPISRQALSETNASSGPVLRIRKIE
jgi:small-conductance mechanosensitive channel